LLRSEKRSREQVSESSDRVGAGIVASMKTEQPNLVGSVEGELQEGVFKYQEFRDSVKAGVVALVETEQRDLSRDARRVDGLQY
jgi:hypothetical protein